MADRAKSHALNALALLFNQDSLRKKAGTGQRQGSEDAKPVNL